MSITIKELAKIAGVSHTVVSGVLSNNPKFRVSEATRNKILQLCCEYDCQPNRSARRLRGCDMKTVFFLTRVHPSPGHSLLLKEVTGLLQENNYQVFMAQTASAEQTERQVAEIMNFGCSAILSCYTHYIPKVQNTLPMVVISDYSDVPHDVGIDREYGIELLTEHLLEHGHRKIGFICCGQWGVKEMTEGYCKVLRKYSITPQDTWRLDFLYNTAGKKMLEKMIVTEKLTAFVCASDFIAGRLIAVLNRMGVRVPQDIAVTGTDAMSFSEFTRIPLTTVLYPYRLTGRTAANLLLSRIRAEADPEEEFPIMVKPRLHVGGSCGCVNHGPDQMLGTVPVFSLEEQIKNEEEWLSGHHA